jgi:crotonobetainyl-CoA:carnitine CoA-transferase CaiB-like acyl-CoA transferase
MANQSSAYAAGGVVPMRMGNLHPSLTPYEPLPTGDGDLVIAVGNDNQFARLCAVLGAPGLASDPRFAQNVGRTSHRAELRAELAGRLAARTSAEWAARLAEAGIPCGPINTVEGGVATAAELGLAPIVAAGGIPGIRNPITLSATPPDYPLPPPALDEHGDQIRAWLAAPPDGSGPIPGETPDD